MYFEYFLAILVSFLIFLRLRKKIKKYNSIYNLNKSITKGIEIINDKTGEPDKERTNRIHQQALRNGLIMITAGTFGNIIRTLMPLTIDKATLNEGIDILINALKTH